MFCVPMPLRRRRNSSVQQMEKRPPHRKRRKALRRRRLRLKTVSFVLEPPIRLIVNYAYCTRRKFMSQARLSADAASKTKCRTARGVATKAQNRERGQALIGLSATLPRRHVQELRADCYAISRRGVGWVEQRRPTIEGWCYTRSFHNQVMPLGR